MPSSYVHEQVALRAFAAFAGSFGEQPLHRAAFLAGAQGPDPLFFYQVVSPGRNAPVSAWAQRLHTERTAAFLCALCREVDARDPLLTSYAWGFLTHYATDCTLHPFVYAHSFDGSGRYRTENHGLLEAALETWLFREQEGGRIPRQMTGLSSLGGGERVRIAQSLINAMRKVFGAAPTQEEILISFSDCVALTRLLYSPLGVKGRLLVGAGALLGKGGLVASHLSPTRLPRGDFLHLSGAGWVSPWQPDVPRHESVPELLDLAAERSARYLAKAAALWQGKAKPAEFALLLGDLGYDSALPWAQAFSLSDGQTLKDARAAMLRPSPEQQAGC